MKRIDQVKKLIDIDNVNNFITQSRRAADEVEAIFNSTKPDDEKLLEIFDACVTLGLYDESDLPS